MRKEHSKIGVLAPPGSRAALGVGFFSCGAMREEQLRTFCGTCRRSSYPARARTAVCFVNEAMKAVIGGPVQEGQSVAAAPGSLPADLLEVMQQVYQSGRPFVAKAYRLPALARGRRLRRATSTLLWNPCAKAAGQ
jgi:hypothetical protein